MPRYNIEYDNTTTIRRNFPDEISDVKAASLVVYDRGGTALLTADHIAAPSKPECFVGTSGSTNTPGAHFVKITYAVFGETELSTASDSVEVNETDTEYIDCMITVSSDSRVTGRNIYMTEAGGSTYYLAGAVTNNTATTYTIDIDDTTLAGMPEAPTTNTATVYPVVTNVGDPTTYSWLAVLTTATRVGEHTATFDATPDTIYAGDVYRLGSTTSSQDTLTVESYNATTRTVTFTDYFRHAHAAGEYLKPRFCTYDLITTTEATWTSGLELTFVWTFFSDGAGITTPYMPYTDLGQVVKRISGEGGMESAFRMRYRQFGEMVADVDFVTLASDAEEELKDLFASKGLAVEKVVDSHAFYELRLAQMAYALSVGMGGDWDAERASIEKRRLELIKLVSSNPVWADTDQGLSEADEEVQTYERPYPRRRLF